MIKTYSTMKLKRSLNRLNAVNLDKAKDTILLVSPYGAVVEGNLNTNQSIIDRIDPANPSQADLRALSDELVRLRNVDVRNVDPTDLVDVQNIKINMQLPLLERTIDYIKQVRNPYCYKINGVVIKANFMGFSSIDECLEEALYAGGTSNYY